MYVDKRITGAFPGSERMNRTYAVNCIDMLADRELYPDPLRRLIPACWNAPDPNHFTIIAAT